MTLTNQSVAALNIPNVSGTKTHGPARVIKVASALKETPTVNGLTATVGSGFKKFSEGDLMHWQRRVHRRSESTATVSPPPATMAPPMSSTAWEDIARQTGQRTRRKYADVPNSSISFMGDFSFTEQGVRAWGCRLRYRDRWGWDARDEYR